MRYVKERNFIVAYDVNHNARGKWNILTNEFYGVKGTLVKGCPEAFKAPAHYDMPRAYYSAFSTVWEYVHRDRMLYTPALARRIEEIVSVGLSLNGDYDTWRSLSGEQIKLTKEVVTYITEKNNGTYSNRIINQYIASKKYHGLFDEYPDNCDWLERVLRRVPSHIPDAFVLKMIRQGIKEKVFTYYGAEYSDVIRDWYDMTKTMNEVPNADHNIISNFVILLWRYQQYKDAHYDDILKAQNDKPSLYYENDTYIVFPLLSKADFHNEAEHQHNCVETMYMNKVLHGETHVVAVRKKNEKDKSYITCEVRNNGDIVQYLLACNTRPSEQADIDFWQEYQNHLSEYFKKE